LPATGPPVILPGMNRPKPSYVSYHVTNRCDGRCNHCHIWSRPEGPEIPVEAAVKLADDLADWLGDSRVIVSGGEPLLSRNTLPFVRRAAKRGMEVFVVSNGLYLAEAEAKNLADAGVLGVRISLDGFEETHNRMRNRDDAFGRVWHAIKAVSAYPQIELGVNCVIMRENLEEIPSLVEMATREPRLFGITFQAVAQPFGEVEDPDWYEGHRLWPADADRVGELIDRLIVMKEKGERILNPVAQLLAMKAYFRNPNRFTLEHCSVGDHAVTVTEQGYVHLCFAHTALGNITEEGIRQMFESERAEKIRAEMEGCKKNCHLLINCCFDPGQLILPE
jgi:MoaA/NifB/PqqE/SkfB family radical SAM enzyme